VGQEIGSAPGIEVFALETPFDIDSDLSASCGWYVTISVAKESSLSFLAVFKLFHACICNRL
jgi:hypothetical protein